VQNLTKGAQKSYMYGWLSGGVRTLGITEER
jgi:hypothetical protein